MKMIKTKFCALLFIFSCSHSPHEQFVRLGKKVSLFDLRDSEKIVANSESVEIKFKEENEFTFKESDPVLNLTDERRYPAHFKLYSVIVPKTIRASLAGKFYYKWDSKGENLVGSEVSVHHVKPDQSMTQLERVGDLVFPEKSFESIHLNWKLKSNFLVLSPGKHYFFFVTRSDAPLYHKWQQYILENLKLEIPKKSKRHRFQNDLHGSGVFTIFPYKK